MEKTQKSRKTWAPASYALHILKGGLTLVILEICIISMRIYKQKKISKAILNSLPTKCVNSTDIQGQIMHKSKYWDKVIYLRYMAGHSLLDNAPNCSRRCVIQKRKITMPLIIRLLLNNSYLNLLTQSLATCCFSVPVIAS